MDTTAQLAEEQGGQAWEHPDDRLTAREVDGVPPSLTARHEKSARTKRGFWRIVTRIVPKVFKFVPSAIKGIKNLVRKG